MKVEMRIALRVPKIWKGSKSS